MTVCRLPIVIQTEDQVHVGLRLDEVTIFVETEDYVNVVTIVL